jgi:hypothetical protein
MIDFYESMPDLKEFWKLEQGYETISYHQMAYRGVIPA